MFLFLTLKFGFDELFFKRRLDFQTNVRHVQALASPAIQLSNQPFSSFATIRAMNKFLAILAAALGANAASVRKLLSREQANATQSANYSARRRRAICTDPPVCLYKRFNKYFNVSGGIGVDFDLSPIICN